MYEAFISHGKSLKSIASDESKELMDLVAKQACLNTHEFVAVFHIPEELPEQKVDWGTAPRTKYSEPGDIVRIQIFHNPPRYGELISLYSPHSPRSVAKKSVCPPAIMAGNRDRRANCGYHADNRQERKLAFADLEVMGILKYASQK